MIQDLSFFHRKEYSNCMNNSELINLNYQEKSNNLFQDLNFCLPDFCPDSNIQLTLALAVAYEQLICFLYQVSDWLYGLMKHQCFNVFKSLLFSYGSNCLKSDLSRGKKTFCADIQSVYMEDALHVGKLLCNYAGKLLQ